MNYKDILGKVPLPIISVLITASLASAVLGLDSVEFYISFKGLMETLHTALHTM